MEGFLTIWGLSGFVGWMIFKTKTIQGEGVGGLSMFIFQIVGGLLTLYLSITEPSVTEQLKHREDAKRKQELQEKARQYNLRRMSYDKEIAELKIEASKRVMWKRYHSMLSSTLHVDEMDGKEFEKFIAVLYSRMGYEVKQVSLGTDQGVDLILIDENNKRIAVQAKRWSKAVGNAAVQQVLAGKKYHNCQSAVVVTNSHFTRQAVELAQPNKVTLIDKPKLIKLCYEYLTVTSPKFNEVQWLKIQQVASSYSGIISETETNDLIKSDYELSLKKRTIDQKYTDITVQ